MRGIIDYSGEKSFVGFITHAGNGGIVVAITEPGIISGRVSIIKNSFPKPASSITKIF